MMAYSNINHNKYDHQPASAFEQESVGSSVIYALHSRPVTSLLFANIRCSNAYKTNTNTHIHSYGAHGELGSIAPDRRSFMKTYTLKCIYITLKIYIHNCRRNRQFAHGNTTRRALQMQTHTLRIYRV